MRRLWAPLAVMCLLGACTDDAQPVPIAGGFVILSPDGPGSTPGRELAPIHVPSVEGTYDVTPEPIRPWPERVPDLEVPEPHDERYSPLAQLTHAEFILALSHLLQLPADMIRALPEANGLPAERESEGLVSAANRQGMSQLQVAGYAALSGAVADAVLDGLDLPGYRDLLDCAQLEAERAAERADLEGPYTPELCTRDFAIGLLEQGFRGHFDDADVERLDTLLTRLDALLMPVDQDEAGLPAALALRFKSVVQLTVLSPKFLLLIEHGLIDPDAPEDVQDQPLTQAEIANRIAVFLTGMPPDDDLAQAAAEGRLATPEGRVEAAHRLLDTPEAVAGTVQILTPWLGVDDRADAASVATLQAFLTDWIVNDRPFRHLYTAPIPVQYIDQTESVHAFGVLGMRAVVASGTSAPTPSFINRGEFITERLLCAHLPEDLPDAALAGEAGSPEEIFTQHATSPCATCHHVFDNYGAALQRFHTDTALFDPAANSLGDQFDLSPIGDVEGVIADAADLGAIMGASRQARSCMLRLWYRHSIRRDLVEGDADEAHIAVLMERWSLSGDHSLRALLRVIVADPDFARLLR